jgi:hypothetical protein
MKEKHFQNEFVEMWLYDGIIFIEHAPFVTITLEIAQINVAARLKICDGKTYPVFADVRKAKNMSKETREFLSKDDGIRGISAGAFLVGTRIEAWIVNAWLSINPLTVPTKLFTEKDKALDWLQQFKRIN